MKRILSIIMASAVAAVCSISANAQGRELVVLGDSITSGYGLDGYVSGDNYSAGFSFANRLAEDFGGYENFAVDGRTSAELLTALDDADIAAALAGADTVVVSIGGNDFLKPMIGAAQSAIMSDPDLLSAIQSGEKQITEENYMQIMSDMITVILDAVDSIDVSVIGDNICKILDEISELNSECQVIILTVYDPFEGVEGMEMMDVAAREKLGELNAEICEEAKAHGIDVAFVDSAFAGHALEYTNIASMDIHPNKMGHGVIYSLLSELTAQQASVSDGSYLPEEADGNVNADDSSTVIPAKGSPDTGAEGAAVFAGIAALAAAGVFMFGKRK